MNDMEMRELDAWIAEYVFGWNRQRFNNGHVRHNILVPEKFRADKYRKHGWNKGVELIDNFPHYTTDPAAAMDVLEKCAIKSGYGLTVIPQSNGMWFACSNYANEAFGETLNIAICLLAKKLFTK